MQMISHSIHGWFGQITDLTTFLCRLLLTIRQAFQDSRFVLYGSGKLRRFGLVHFQKGYVRRQLSVRQGACRQCSVCCNLLFTCPMLTKKGGCLVYSTCRPQACKVFPLDQRDIDEVNLCVSQCGYCFNEENSGKVRKMERP